MVDHHEPGPGERGIRISNEWCEKYNSNIEGIKDDFGNPVQYSWFYPYDHLNSQVLFNLNELVFAGLGEVEFHWHLLNETNETFPLKLKDAVEWFNSHGCMLSTGLTPEPHFAYVAGNWALDNGSGKSYQCGVNRQLDILREYGCYADMTFSTLGTQAQPSKINSIYYAKDTDEPKSYNIGVDAEVGSPNSDFMIFEGPICIDWHDRIFECAGFESTSPFKRHRVKLWLKYAPIVKGRPDWLFLKVYTHGAQSRDVIISEQFRDMCFELKKVCHEYGLSLHFVTAREAFNIVKAAEQGHDGNPELYRDYILKKPINQVVTISSRIKNAILDESKIECILDNDANKQEKRLYGTSLMVRSPGILKDVKNAAVILRAGVYNKEIKKDILENIRPDVTFWE